MSDPRGPGLDEKQLAALDAALARGSAHASQQLTKWIEKPSLVEIDSVLPMPLEEATELLSADDDPVCFCAMEMQGKISGEIILVVDDASGFALADMVLGNSIGQTSEWTELATSCLLETTNIVGCAYLNSLSETLSASGAAVSLVPSPPAFRRDFPQCLLQFALMAQAMTFDQVMVAQTRFLVQDKPLSWKLLFIPDADSMRRLPGLLSPASNRGQAKPGEFNSEPME